MTRMAFLVNLLHQLLPNPAFIPRSASSDSDLRRSSCCYALLFPMQEKQKNWKEILLAQKTPSPASPLKLAFKKTGQANIWIAGTFICWRDDQSTHGRSLQFKIKHVLVLEKEIRQLSGRIFTKKQIRKNISDA